MGRRSGFGSVLMAAARATARAARQAEAAQRKEMASRQRQAKAYSREVIKATKEAEKRAKQEYLESRTEEAEDLTKESNELFRYLIEGIIPETLEIDDTIDFESLKPDYELPVFELPKDLKPPFKPSEDAFLEGSRKEPFFGFLFPSIKRKWKERVESAKTEYQQSLQRWEYETQEHHAHIEKLKSDFEVFTKKCDLEYTSKCLEVDDFRKDYLDQEEEAVSTYIGMVLERSSYEIDWEREFRVGYSKNSKEVLIEFRLPNLDLIPLVGEFKYIKSKDEIEEKLRKKTDVETCYRSLIASLAVRTIHEIVESDGANAVASIGFNGYVEAIDQSNGRFVKPTLISVYATKKEFEAIHLHNVDPVKCVKGLSASVSSSATELVAVKPIRELNMVDKRFVDEEDVASGLDERQNLMDLNPFQFENLVSNLFSKMGLETKQTRTTKDGGVDAIAFDLRPILGGKIVIQAKRYKNTVGVSAVRDLYGTMLNEGATKGILVTTSFYGPDAFEFAKNKPIDLIEGGGLLYLLNQVGVKAKIVLPD